MSRVPELFRAGTLSTLRPALIQQHLQQHVGPQQALAAEHTPAEPQLLKRLHALLDAAAVQGALVSQSQHGADKCQARRELQAHHQVFELLLASLTTYRPLLLRIKAAYDRALQDAAAAACDNIHLCSKLSAVPQRHAEAVAAAQQDAEKAAAGMMAELEHKLRHVEQQTLQVEAECIHVEEQLQHMRKHVLQAHRELDQLEVYSRRVHREGSSWQMLCGPAD